MYYDLCADTHMYFCLVVSLPSGLQKMYATKSRRHFAATHHPVPLIKVLRPQSSTKDSSIIIIM